MKNMFTRKALLIILLMLTFSVVIASVGRTSPFPIITKTNSTATVYLNPPSINGTAIGVNNTVTVGMYISDVVDISGWQAGLLFNGTVLNCTGYFEGEFFKNTGYSTYWQENTINNTSGEVAFHGCYFLGDYKTSGSGRLAYFNFTVKAPGVSDLHLRDTELVSAYTTVVPPVQVLVPTNIIDVYTVVLDTTSHTIVIVSNSTDNLGGVSSGLSGHSFNNDTKEISFKVEGPYNGFCKVSIPITLLPVDSLDDWTLIIGDKPLSTAQRTVTENATHYSIYFTYAKRAHNIGLTTREFLNSTISINLSSDTIKLGSDVTISGMIDPVRPNFTVTIERESADGTWSALGNAKTDSNSSYSYKWTPDATGTHKIRARWYGDLYTKSAVSDEKTLRVKEAEGMDPYILAAVAVPIIIVVIAIVIYFVKIRKPAEE